MGEGVVSFDCLVVALTLSLLSLPDGSNRF